LGDSIFPTAASTQRSRRGTIQVLDRPGLEKASCECYAVVNERFDAFLTPPSTAVPGHNKKPKRSSRKRLSVPPPSGSERRGPVILQMSVSTFASDTVRPQRDVKKLFIPTTWLRQTFTKEQSMRNSLPTESELEQGQQTVLFEIANGNARQACSLKTKFPTQLQASRYLRQNWNRIEQMARDCLARECFEDGRIKLVMI
jgi:hypothetical protein